MGSYPHAQILRRHRNSHPNRVQAIQLVFAKSKYCPRTCVCTNCQVAEDGEEDSQFNSKWLVAQIENEYCFSHADHAQSKYIIITPLLFLLPRKQASLGTFFHLFTGNIAAHFLLLWPQFILFALFTMLRHRHQHMTWATSDYPLRLVLVASRL